MEQNIEKSKVNNLPSVEQPWLKYYTEEQKNLKTPERTLYQHLYMSNLNNLNAVAIDYYGTKITFRELFKKIDECCKSFSKIGVKQGDIVTICMPNLPEAVIAVYALNKMGAISNMVHPLKSENEIKSYIKTTNSKYVIALENIVEKINNEDVVIISCSPKNSMPLVTKSIYSINLLKEKIKSNDKVCKKNNYSNVIQWNQFIKDGKNFNYEEIKTSKDDIAVLLHTGGTAGDAKTVALSSHNFNSMITQLWVTADNFAVGDKMLTIMPIFHGFGLCSSIHLPLCFGVSIILVPKFDKNNFATLLKKKPNHIIGVPTLFKAMMSSKEIDKMDLSFIKYVVAGGDAMQNEEEFNQFLRKHNSTSELYKGYGLSETVAGATFGFGECNKIGSIGIPMVNTIVKITDVETGKELSYNERGEICISGPTIMEGGYYNNVSNTNKAIEIDSNNIKWLHTGDIGYMDEDGVIFYSQRLDRMFQSSGVNVYPNSIENELMKITEIDSCLVVPKKHTYKGKVPVAFIKLKNGTLSIAPELIKKINERCKLNLDRYHQLDEIIPISNFPQTLIGKVDYIELSKIVNNEKKSILNELDKDKVKILKKSDN